MRIFLKDFILKSVYVPHGHLELLPWSGSDTRGERWWKNERQIIGYQFRGSSAVGLPMALSHSVAVGLDIRIFRILE